MKAQDNRKGIRLLGEDQLRAKLKKLESNILRITSDPIDKHNDTPFLDWYSDSHKVKRVRDMMAERKEVLDALFKIHCTDKDIVRLERINVLLLKLTNQAFHRTANYYRAFLAMPEKEKDTLGGHVYGTLSPFYIKPSCVLRLEDDEYYGSDFMRMARILTRTEKYGCRLNTQLVRQGLSPEYIPSMTDEELGTINTLDDGVSWAEGPLQNPKFKHFTICYALHDLCTHMNFSIPDILRMNDFKVEVKLTVHQFSDQDRKRLK